MPDAPTSWTPRVVIVGGGFGGLMAARRLRNAPVEVLLIDRRNYHLFQPLLYQVATASLSPANVATPIRRVLRRQANATVVLAEVEAIDLERRILRARGRDVSYDYLVIASGAETSYFDHPEFSAYAPGLKDLDDAVDIRRRVLLAFEEAELETDPERRRARLTFVIVGGGPTGVELAGAIAETAQYTLPEDFRSIDTRSARVLLVEAADRLLGTMPAGLAVRALRDLEALGVEVRLGQLVEDVAAGQVTVAGETIATDNVIWAAGVQATGLLRSLGVPLDRAGRVPVGPDLSIAHRPEVFVVGDAARAVDPKSREPVPGVAQGAIQMGRFVADIIHREARKGPAPRPVFRYRDKGTMATIGRGRAVAALGRLEIAGFPGWVIWGLVHIFFLIGFRTKAIVFLEWLWYYVIFERGMRLITGYRPPPGPDPGNGRRPD